MTEEEAVFQQESAIQHLFTAFHVEGFGGTFVQIGQHAVLVVIQHVEQRRIENRLIAHQQLVDFLLSLILLSHVMLYSHQQGGQSVVTPTHHRERYLIISTVQLFRRPTPDIRLSLIHLAFANGEDHLAHSIHIVTMEKQGKIRGIVFSLIVTFLRQVTEIARRRVVKPQTQLTGLHDQRQASLLLIIVYILFHRLDMSCFRFCKNNHFRGYYYQFFYYLTFIYI